MPSPKPTPSKLKELKGNPGKRPLNEDEPIFSAMDETAPESLDEEGAAEWNRIVDELRTSGVVTKMDETILWAYCQEFSIAKKAAKELKGNGLIIKAPSGYPIKNPYLSIQHRSLYLLKSLASELGLSPSSRSRVVAIPTKKGDKYEQLKNERAARKAKAIEKLKEPPPSQSA